MDQEDGARGDLADPVGDRRRCGLVGEDGGREPQDRERRPEHVAGALQVGLADGVAGAFRHDRLEVGRLRGRLDQDLAADGEAEPADPVVVHVGAGLEVLGAGEQVAVARPADGVAFARALAARVQEQDAVAVPDQHPGLGGAGRAGEEDHRGAVLGGDVRARQLDRVARRDGDLLVRDAEVGLDDAAPGVRVRVGEADREDDEPEGRERQCRRDGERQSAAEVGARSGSVRAPRPPQDGEPGDHQDDAGEDRQRAGRVVVARRLALREPVRARDAERDPEGAEGQCEPASHPGADARVEDGDGGEEADRDESAREVVERRGAGLGLEVVVVGDVQPDRAERERHNPSLGAGVAGGARHDRLVARGGGAGRAVVVMHRGSHRIGGVAARSAGVSRCGLAVLGQT